MYNCIYSIFYVYYTIFDYFSLTSFSLSNTPDNYMGIKINLFVDGQEIFYDVGQSLGFNLAMLCTIITLILLLYMVYKICKLIICRIANV